MSKAPAAAADGPVFQPGGNEHVEESFTAIPEDERVPVMDRVVARRRRGEGVGLAFSKRTPSWQEGMQSPTK